MINEQQAIAIACEFLTKNNLDSQYHKKNPTVYMEADNYMVEFNDIDKDKIPGVCIVAVNKDTGDAYFEPVE